MYSIRIIARILAGILEFVKILMLVRAVLSWVPTVRSNRFFDFTYMVTDYVVRPVRLFMVRMGLDTALPIDLSFLIAFILIGVVERFLYVI